jgi:hypothetical protein
MQNLQDDNTKYMAMHLGFLVHPVTIYNSQHKPNLPTGSGVINKTHTKVACSIYDSTNS